MGDPISHVVTPIVKKLIDQSSSLIKERYLRVKGLKKDVEELTEHLTTIQYVLEDAEEKQVNDRALKDWLLKLKEAAYDAEDLLDVFQTKASRWNKRQQESHFRPISSIPTNFDKYDVAHKIKKLLERLDKISKEKEKFHLNQLQVNGGRPQTPDRPLTGFFVDSSVIVGRDDDKEKIINLLLSDNDSDEDGNGHVSVIPIVGMGGLGKTTLAQLVFNDERIKSHFKNPTMWVCVTTHFDLDRILKEMIQFHSEMKFDFTIPRPLLESRLLDILTGNRFLLVLDDLWMVNDEDWESLLRLLKQGGRGSRVLVTSRITTVSENLRAKPSYCLSFLPDEKCWSLFENIAFTGGNSSTRQELEEIGRQIVRKCDGLPLAIKAMAGLLRGIANVDEWRKILRSEMWEVEEQNSDPRKLKILPALKFSYYHLPPHLKPCFAFCSLFPKAYVFNKNELVKLWMGVAFIQPKEQETAEKTGNKYFNDLLERSFFQFSIIDKKELYKMHDLIHDLAQSIWSTESSRYFSIHCADGQQPSLEIIQNSKKLRAILLPGYDLKNLGQSLDKMFHAMSYVRVLDLSSSTMLTLPKSIEKLELLRYLDLSNTEIKELPNTICNLSKLQTLKLLRCLWLFELPEDLSNLISLRHLELDDMFWNKSSSTLPPKLGSLASLQDLHAFEVGLKRGCGIDELKDMVHLTGTLHISKLENAVNAGDARLKEKDTLHEVVLEWSKNVDPQDEVTEERKLEDLQPHPNIKVLQIRHYKGSKFPTWMKDGLLRNLVSVSLNHCTKCRVLCLGHLPHLRQLYIKGMLDLEEWSTWEAQRPSQLDTLKISNCPNLTKLPPFFPTLRVLKIKNCKSLKALPVVFLLQFLILIDNLALEDWNEVQFERICNETNQGEPTIRYSFRNLLELKVNGCPKLQALPNVFFPQKLEISECELLTTLPITEHAKRFQHMALDSCPDGTLVKAIPNSSSLYSLVISNISNLITLPKWPNLPGLKALYIRGCKDLESLAEEEERSFQSLTSLKLLSIRDCPKLVALPKEGLPTALECMTIGSCNNLKSLGPQEMLKSLTNLKDLYIEDCPSLESLPEEGFSASLKHLLIQGCPLLTKRCQKEEGGGPDWPKIMDIPDLEIESPTKLCPGPALQKKKKIFPRAHRRPRD